MSTIELEGGKYTVTYESGKLQALRYGEPWRDMTGDKLIGCMVSEIERLRGLQPNDEQSSEYELHTKGARHSFEPTDSAGYTLGPVSYGGLDPRDRQAEPVAPQPAESCASPISDKTACGSANGDCDSQPAEPVDIPVGWKEQFKEAVYENLAAADNQDIPLEEYPDRILEVLETAVGPRHPTVVKWRNDAIRACLSIAHKYCRDADTQRYLKQDLEALITAAPQPAEPVNLCDCERSHNGLGMGSRECDCPAGQSPQPAEPVKHKRQYAQGTALGEFGIIPMCDQVDDEPVKVPSERVGVAVSDIKEWRSEWLAENDPRDGTDCVTPFDKYLYGQPAQPSVPAGLPEILREAAAIITAIPREHAPQNIRWPIADELEGFASIIEDNQPNQGKE